MTGDIALTAGLDATEIVKRLCDAGAHVNAIDNSGRSPLHQAAEFSPFPNVVMALLDAGADAKIEDHKGRTAYDIAVDNSRLTGSNAFWRLNDARF